MLEETAALAEAALAFDPESEAMDSDITNVAVSLGAVSLDNILPPHPVRSRLAAALIKAI